MPNINLDQFLHRIGDRFDGLEIEGNGGEYIFKIDYNPRTGDFALIDDEDTFRTAKELVAKYPNLKKLTLEIPLG